MQADAGIRRSRLSGETLARMQSKDTDLKYVHGYILKENIRLQDQASTLVELRKR